MTWAKLVRGQIILFHTASLKTECPYPANKLSTVTWISTVSCISSLQDLLLTYALPNIFFRWVMWLDQLFSTKFVKQLGHRCIENWKFTWTFAEMKSQMEVNTTYSKQKSLVQLFLHIFSIFQSFSALCYLVPSL